MTKEREALTLALEALEEIHVANMTPMAETNWNKAITAIKEALAQPEQEPVARMLVKDGIGWIEWKNPIRLSDGLHDLHTTTQQRTWAGLTDVEIASACKKNGGAEWWWRDIEEYGRAIEAKLKEKNT